MKEINKELRTFQFICLEKNSAVIFIVKTKNKSQQVEAKVRRDFQLQLTNMLVKKGLLND